MPIDSKLAHAIVSLRQVADAQYTFDPVQWFFVPSVLIETNREHNSDSLFGVRTLFKLNHEAAIAV